jgi:hypothetical protein
LKLYIHLIAIVVSFNRLIMDEDMDFDSGVAAVPQQPQYQPPVQTVPEDGRRLL